MELKLAAKSGTEVQAAYVCTCGCRPRVTYARDAENRKHVCCCGAQLVVGREAVNGLDLLEDSRPQTVELDAPWGEVVQASWLVGSGMHGSGHGADAHSHGDHSHGH
jgi:hypothetical protein